MERKKESDQPTDKQSRYKHPSHIPNRMDSYASVYVSYVSQKLAQHHAIPTSSLTTTVPTSPSSFLIPIITCCWPHRPRFRRHRPLSSSVCSLSSFFSLTTRRRRSRLLLLLLLLLLPPPPPVSSCLTAMVTVSSSSSSLLLLRGRRW